MPLPSQFLLLLDRAKDKTEALFSRDERVEFSQAEFAARQRDEAQAQQAVGILAAVLSSLKPAPSVPPSVSTQQQLVRRMQQIFQYILSTWLRHFKNST